jgi:DNA polymerase-1
LRNWRKILSEQYAATGQPIRYKPADGQWDDTKILIEDKKHTVDEKCEVRFVNDVSIPNVRLIQDPSDLPNYTSYKQCGFDIETKDPTLLTLGPGPRRDGYVVGFSVAVDDDVIYVPVKHDIGTNMPVEAVKGWLKENIFRDGLTKVGHNISYDLDHMQESNIVDSARVIHYGGKYEDTYTNELLLFEDKTIKKTLDAVSFRRLGIRKQEDELQKAAERRGFKEAKKDLWRMLPEEVYSYGGIDAFLTLKCSELQNKEIEIQNLTKAQGIEQRLIPLLMLMRHTGVLVDKKSLYSHKETIKDQIQAIHEEIKHNYGATVAPWEAAAIAKVADKIGLAYPKTYKTNAPSFTADFFKSTDHPFFKLIAKLRSLDKVVGTFLEGQLEKHMIGDRIHPIFKNDGTITGRFSGEHPNGQFFPKRDEELATIVRGILIPSPGKKWFSYDYSQIEYRLLVHFGVGPGIERVIEAFTKNPELSYHILIQEMLLNEVGMDVPYKKVKNINFGIIYGQGLYKTMAVLGLNKAETKEFLAKYHRAVPFAKPTMQAAIKAIEKRGFIRTLLGRRRRFNTWEPSNWNAKYLNNERVSALPYEEALAKYGPGIERANAYKGLNACLQGSAGEIIKVAMVQMFEQGIFDVITPPLLQVHDELDFEIDINNKQEIEAAKEVKYIMENAVKLRIPLLVDVEYGNNWGKLEAYDF